MTELPPRYEPIGALGRGGGGEVWSVRDTLTGRTLALKLLAPDAGDQEVAALVREASALSGLEGLGVPLVVAFGRLPDTGRSFLVRELVEGKSLEEVLDAPGGGSWVPPLVRAAEQLTVLHRAGLFHGDVKPANVIVSPSGEATLVDLGLAAPWREGGTRARGFTPRFAAPELLRGEPLTVRAEVFALGAAIQVALERRPEALSDDARARVAAVAEHATRPNPRERPPSVDEVATVLAEAAGLTFRAFGAGSAWPVLGVDAPARELLERAVVLPPGGRIVVSGPAGAGTSTLLRRLAWSLGVAGERVLDVDGAAPDEAVARLLRATTAAWARAHGPSDRVVVVDAPGSLGREARAALAEAIAAGAKLVVGGRADGLVVGGDEHEETFVVAPLDRAISRELLRRAVPSLPDGLVEHVADRLGDRPGPLRAFVRTLGTRAVVGRADVDEVLDEQLGPHEPGRAPSLPPSSTTPAARRAALERALATGRFDVARELLAALEGDPGGHGAAVALARARIALARGEIAEASRALEGAGSLGDAERRVHALLSARVALRAGAYAESVSRSERALSPDGAAPPDAATSAEALAVAAIAEAYLGDDAAAVARLARAEALAEPLLERRAAALVQGSLAIVHQRAARNGEARKAYLRATAEAERANDAWTLATTRLNLAGLAQSEGDLAEALGHLEAGVDLGRRAGVPLAVLQATLNLANLDLYLGRYARARAAIGDLSTRRGELQPNARAQLLGLEAELTSRTGDPGRAAALYERSAEAWDAVGRPLDAAEARLEGLLAEALALREARRSEGGPSPAELAQLDARLERLRASLGADGYGEHAPLARLVEGELALSAGDEARAKGALDEAVDRASATDRRDWAWRAREARARLFATQGAFQLARRDSEHALEVLEGIAAKLPRDLREVFWNDPRRRALRVALGRSASVHDASSLTGGGTSEATMLASASFTLGGSVHGGSVSTIGTPLPQEDRLARIFAITRDLARDQHDLERVLERVTDHAVQIASAERGLVVLLDEHGEPRVHTSRDGRGVAGAEAFSRSVAERVVSTGEPIVATSAQDDAGLAQAASVHRHLIQSIACVPIRGPSGRTIGALYLETRRRPGLRFRAELPTLGAFADQAAIAIESARLIDENRRRAEELARANEELERAKAKLADSLGRRTEQLETARRDLKAVRAEIRAHFGYQGLVGTSGAMRKLYALLDRVKDTEVPVLIRGESGTGKEVVAKAIHQAGPRGKGPFLGVNCGAIPANLLESELFGHIKGAFTGADRDRKGMFREAERGTILLDEIGEMPQKMQAGLLRVLQEKTVRPVGGTREEPCDARVVAATNRDLATMVREGTFREDLFYRLHVVEILVPPLRDRREDLPLLVDHFLGIFSARHRREKKSLDRDAMRELQAYPWPGNVRQLEHVLLNAWILSDGDEIGLDDLTLPADVPSGPGALSSHPGPAAGISEIVPRARSKDEYRDVEKERILAALDATAWNRVKAAEKLGMPRRTFYRRLKEYGIL